MKKPEGFSMSELYKSLDEERVQSQVWTPRIPIDILKFVYDCRTGSPPIPYTKIVKLLNKQGITYPTSTLKYNYYEAIKRKIFDSD